MTTRKRQKVDLGQHLDRIVAHARARAQYHERLAKKHRQIEKAVERQR
jgi:hypothetical protein